MKTFIFNNNHVWARTYGKGGKAKGRIVKRDFSGHHGIVCDRCEKKIHNPSYVIEVLKTRIRFTINGSVHVQKLIGSKRTKFIDIFIATGAKPDKKTLHFCGTCQGVFKDSIDNIQ